MSSNYAEWRKRWRLTGEELTLPSGLIVRVRRVSLIDLVGNGQIPITLDTLVKKATTEGFGVEDIGMFMPLVNAVVRSSLIEPSLADESDDEHIALTDIPVMDRLHIFGWANGEAETLKPFRVQQEGDVVAPLGVLGVQNTPEHDPGNPGRVDSLPD